MDDETTIELPPPPEAPTYNVAVAKQRIDENKATILVRHDGCLIIDKDTHDVLFEGPLDQILSEEIAAKLTETALKQHKLKEQESRLLQLRLEGYKNPPIYLYEIPDKSRRQRAAPPVTQTVYRNMDTQLRDSVVESMRRAGVRGVDKNSIMDNEQHRSLAIKVLNDNLKKQGTGSPTAVAIQKLLERMEKANACIVKPAAKTLPKQIRELIRKHGTGRSSKRVG